MHSDKCDYIMLKFSEIGNSCAAWRHLLRTGRSSLKIKKGPNGHFLDEKCNEELKKSLPEEAYVELVNWVDSSIKQIDKRNSGYTKKDVDPKPGAKPKDPTSIGNQSADNLSDFDEDYIIECVDSNETLVNDVIDLCSDEDSRDGTSTDSVSSRTSSETFKNRTETTQNKNTQGPFSVTSLPNTTAITNAAKKTPILTKNKMELPPVLIKKDYSRRKSLNQQPATQPKLTTTLKSNSGSAEKYKGQCLSNMKAKESPDTSKSAKQVPVILSGQVIKVFKRRDSSGFLNITEALNEPKLPRQIIVPRPVSSLVETANDQENAGPTNNANLKKGVSIKAPKQINPATTTNPCKPIVPPAGVPVVFLKRKHSESDSGSDNSQGPAKRSFIEIHIPQDSSAAITHPKKRLPTLANSKELHSPKPSSHLKGNKQRTSISSDQPMKAPNAKVLPVQNPSADVASSKQGPSKSLGNQLRVQLPSQGPATTMESDSDKVISISKVLPIQNPSNAAVPVVHLRKSHIGGDSIIPATKELPSQKQSSNLEGNKKGQAKNLGVWIRNSGVDSSSNTSDFIVLPGPKASSGLANNKQGPSTSSGVLLRKSPVGSSPIIPATKELPSQNPTSNLEENNDETEKGSGLQSSESTACTTSTSDFEVLPAENPSTKQESAENSGDKYLKVLKSIFNFQHGSDTTSTTKEDNTLSEMTKMLDMLETIEKFTVRQANEEAFFLIKMLRISLIQGLNL